MTEETKRVKIGLLKKGKVEEHIFDLHSDEFDNFMNTVIWVGVDDGTIPYFRVSRLFTSIVEAEEESA